MPRPWNTGEGGDYFKCYCGHEAVVMADGDGFGALCFAHTRGEAAMFPLPPEAPDDFVSGEPPCHTLVQWGMDHEAEEAAEAQDQDQDQ